MELMCGRIDARPEALPGTSVLAIQAACLTGARGMGNSAHTIHYHVFKLAHLKSSQFNRGFLPQKNTAKSVSFEYIYRLISATRLSGKLP
jgi:hypothetical protein